LAKPLQLGGPNGWAQDSMEVLVREGGFIQVVWGGEPDRALAQSPTTSLGAKYRIVYLVPGPSGKDDRVRQDFYPYAKGGPLTYTAPGQPFFDTERTRGGWFRTAPRLTTALVKAGLPAAAKPRAAAPTSTEGGVPHTAWLVGILVTVALAAAGMLSLKRRARPVSA
jgi:hypothetical protein